MKDATVAIGMFAICVALLTVAVELARIADTLHYMATGRP